MFSTTTKTETSTKAKAQLEDRHIFALLLLDGRIAIGMSDNPARRIQNINSGYCSAIPGILQIRQIIGIKQVSEQRTLPSVVAQFCRDFGEDRVVCV